MNASPAPAALSYLAAARYLGLDSAEAARALARKYAVPRVRLGRRVVLLRADLDALLRRLREEPTL